MILPEKVSFEAGRIMLNRINELLAENEDASNWRLIKNQKNAETKIISAFCIFKIYFLLQRLSTSNNVNLCF